MVDKGQHKDGGETGRITDQHSDLKDDKEKTNTNKDAGSSQ